MRWLTCVRILFSVRNPSYVRHYDSVLRLLASRGHEVELAVENLRRKPWPPSVLALAADHATIHLSVSPSLAGSPWFELATRFRQARFYLRFLEPAYRGTPALLARTREKAPPLAVRLGESFVGRTPWLRRALVRALDVLETAADSTPAVREYLQEQKPDVVVLTPLVVLKTAQLDLARAAMALGMRNVFAVASWDHLSSKGELSFPPQRVIVWNETQRQEAVELHGLDSESIVTTGSQIFDQWFGRAPSTTRSEFLARVGLPADRPLLLYVCSALLEGSPPEPEFVLRWLTALRTSRHAELRECSVLVRPHFKRGHEWRDIDLSAAGAAVCWPPAGAPPVDAESKTDYFDSIYHAAATIGLNTSAMIEASILGKPVFTVLAPEFHGSQEGTVHFRYLLHSTDGLLRAATTLDAHADQLSAVLTGSLPDPDRSARFVRTFVRLPPADVTATERFVAAVEELGTRPPPHPALLPWWTRALRPVLVPFARAAAARVRRITAERQREKARRSAERRRPSRPV